MLGLFIINPFLAYLVTENMAFNLYHLSGTSPGLNARLSNEDNVTFKGDSDLSVISLGYENMYSLLAKLKLNAEYFYRNQQGTFEDSEESTGKLDLMIMTAVIT